jgi:hypothetical protein
VAGFDRSMIPGSATEPSSQSPAFNKSGDDRVTSVRESGIGSGSDADPLVRHMTVAFGRLECDVVARWASSTPRSANARCRGRRGGAGDVRHPSFVLIYEEASDGVQRARGLELDSLGASKVNTVTRASVTTTTFLLGRAGSHALLQLAPSTLELVVPLIAFAVIATVMGVVLVRRRLG